MTETNRAEICDPEIATHEYEKLRANALGEINRAPKLTLFLRDGMSAWLRALGDHACATPPNPSAASGDLAADMPGARLAAILSDAILDGMGSAVLPGGN